QGGMGVVYRGRHLELGRRVAIKRLESKIAKDAESFERFRNEAIAASHITSPHVVQVFDWGKAADGAPFLVMELLEGTDLRALFESEGRLPTELAVGIVVQLLRALISTHQAQIVHRDLKPENIFLCQDGSELPFVKLLDFGISKRTPLLADDERRLTRTGAIVGTAAYMSPEQACGELELDERSDLYSVGVILYEALTGQVPHRARTYEGTLVQICTSDADDVRLLAPLVPEALAKVVAQALERNRDQRYATARQFYDALVDTTDLPARPSSPSLESKSESLPSEPKTTTQQAMAATERDTSLAQRPFESVSVNRRGRHRWVWLSAVALLVLAGLWITREAKRPESERAPEAQSGTNDAATTGAASLSSAALGLATTAGSASTPLQVVTAIPAGTEAGAVHGPALDAARGGSQGRAPRPGTSQQRPPGTPPESPGVASGLKLRRTMQ
ncbi:MAG TPA: protein kinase, partial [Polyangiaceae bacterium]